MRLLVVAFLSLLLAQATGPLPAAAGPAIPNYWDERERLPKPNLAELPRLRFLTTVDFPPFSFLDAEGRLAGFHVDLARAICVELGLAERCQIQALPWEELDSAIAARQGEALIAGKAITAEARETYAFSRPYLRFPARFVVRRNGGTIAEPIHRTIVGQRVGVLAGTAHETMLRNYFPGAQPVVYSRQEWLLEDLAEGRVAAAFGDGMRLAFWLGGTASRNCCRFAGGPYVAPEFLGAGLALAARAADADLVAGFDFALREINARGTFAELYLKYFPISFY